MYNQKLQERLRNEQNIDLTFKDLIIIPVQHAPRYALLFKNLYQCSTINDDISKALKISHDLASNSNEASNLKEMMVLAHRIHDNQKVKSNDYVIYVLTRST
jgi:hypothetical protein